MPRFPLACLLAAVVLVGSACAAWNPVPGSMLTKWGRELNPDRVWQEYPRPELVRSEWTNLNGLWDFAVTARGEGLPKTWSEKILVPFAPEAPLSGVGRLIEPGQAVWYRRPLPPTKPGLRAILNFEAVDYETAVFVNGTEVGTHVGGNLPFSFDITDALKAGENELVVRVYDDTEGYQLNGKQRLKAEGIFYTRVTGIWQTVWLENVPSRWIEDLDFIPDIRSGKLTVKAKLSGTPAGGEKLKVTAFLGGREVATATGGETVDLAIADPKLWQPGSPNLYDISADLVGADGKTLDSVKSYAAFRELGTVRDAAGNLRFTINGKPIFHWGPLDQGWWPDGLLTPPSEEAMVSDIEFLQAAGFNMIRKHIKVEPRRYYYDCDRLGMLVWQDQVSGGPGPGWTKFEPNPKDAEWPDDQHEQWATEYKGMVDHLRNHPSIVVWTPFNESWGQHRTMEVGEMAMAYDPSRPINIASGGNFWPVGQIADLHHYPDPGFPLGDPRFADYVKVVGEFGGHGFPVDGHVWDPQKDNWGYGGLPKTIEDWKQRYEQSIDVLARLRQRGISAGVYTQTTDVEGEINGLLTYDRIPKVDVRWLREMSDKLYAAAGVVEARTVLPTSEKALQTWLHTQDQPGAGWEKPEFDDSDWAKGPGGFGVHGNASTHVGTEWNGSDIWLRKTFELPAGLRGHPLLRLYHDNEVEVYLNGIKVLSRPGHLDGYSEFELDDPRALKAGRNTVAVHCHQIDGGQYVDVGLIEEVPVR